MFSMLATTTRLWSRVVCIGLPIEVYPLCGQEIDLSNFGLSIVVSLNHVH